jgi:large subunit ribosomal protein L9
MPNVKLLLNEKVHKLGEVGEIVSVKPGYARNFLIPQGLATIPTPGEVKRIQKKKALLEKQYQEEKQQAEELAKKISDLGKITIIAKAGEAGKLFGRITAKEIVEKLKDEADIEILKKQVLLKKPISEIGEHQIKFKLHSEVSSEVKLVIKNEEE